MKAEDVAQVEIGFGEGQSIEVRREKKEDAYTVNGTPEGKILNKEAVSSLITALVGLRFSETTALDDEKAMAARKHSRTFVLKSFSGQTQTISIGRKPEEKITKPAPAKTDASATDSAKAPAEAAKPAEPVVETIPASPYFVTVVNSDPKATINEMMQKRAFQIDDYQAGSLVPQRDSFWKDAPAK